MATALCCSREVRAWTTVYSISSVIINTILLDVIKVMELLQLVDDVFLARGPPNHTLFNASSLKKAVMYKMNQLMKLKLVSKVEIKLCRFRNLCNT